MTGVQTCALPIYAGTATKTAALATVQKNLRMWEFLLLYLLHQPAPERVAGRPRLQEINRARLELLQCGDNRYDDFGDCCTQDTLDRKSTRLNSSHECASR